MIQHSLYRGLLALSLSLSLLTSSSIALASAHGEPRPNFFITAEDGGGTGIVIETRSELGTDMPSIRFLSVPLDEEGNVRLEHAKELGRGWYALNELSARLVAAGNAVRAGRAHLRESGDELLAKSLAGIGLVAASIGIVVLNGPGMDFIFPGLLATAPYAALMSAKHAIWGPRLVPVDEALLEELGAIYKYDDPKKQVDGPRPLNFDSRLYEKKASSEEIRELERLLGTKPFMVETGGSTMLPGIAFTDMSEGLAPEEIERRLEVVRLRERSQGASRHLEHGKPGVFRR
jgi:hypothetical protein